MYLTTPIAQTVFYAKCWFHYVGASVFTMLFLFCAIFGPLFLFEVIRRADGKPGTDAGVALCIIAVPMCLVAALGWFNVLARRKPLLRICGEGIEINIIGSCSLDGVPLVPTWIRVAWLVLSMQGFKTRTGWIPWEEFRGVQVKGMPMMRTLIIDATIAGPTSRGDQISAQIGNQIAFRDADFCDPLERIASAIEAFHDQPDARRTLPKLHH
jgi:hypothetical protein